MSTEITSEDSLDTEQRFRVAAGPGAGKTRWLLKHVKEVVNQSERLGGVGKVACVSFSNTASEEIQDKLEVSMDRVHVSTTHSFFYHFLVKPYLHLVQDENGEPLVNVDSLSGTTDPTPHRSVVQRFVHGNGKREWHYIPENKERLRAALKNLQWKIESGEMSLTIASRKGQRTAGALKDNLFQYKEYYWRKGLLHYSDVIYFANRLIDENPVLIKHISKRFPYLFIDEYQDTTPLQARIVQKFMDKGSIVGVIGDVEQAIYEFNGARPEEFDALSHSDLEEYHIEGNYRSSRPIVAFLNRVRNDGMDQKALGETAGIDNELKLFVGEESAVQRMRDEMPEVELLAWSNEDVSRLGSTTDGADGIWDEFEQAAGTKRKRFFSKVISGAAHLRNGKADIALRELTPILAKRNGEVRKPLRGGASLGYTDIQRIGIEILRDHVSNQDEYRDSTLLSVYENVSDLLQTLGGLSLTGLREGKGPHTFAKETPYGSLLDTNEAEQVSNNRARTIHMAKGDQFEDVAVYIPGEDCASFLRPGAEGMSDEKRRLYYVACSRARENLYIVTPELGDDAVGLAQEADIEVVT